MISYLPEAILYFFLYYVIVRCLLSFANHNHSNVIFGWDAENSDQSIAMGITSFP